MLWMLENGETGMVSIDWNETLAAISSIVVAVASLVVILRVLYAGWTCFVEREPDDEAAFVLVMLFGAWLRELHVISADKMYYGPILASSSRSQGFQDDLYREAINELKRRKLIKRIKKPEGESYEITHRGTRVAEKIAIRKGVNPKDVFQGRKELMVHFTAMEREIERRKRDEQS